MTCSGPTLQRCKRYTTWAGRRTIRRCWWSARTARRAWTLHHPLAVLREHLARLDVLTEITLPALAPDEVALLLHLLSGERDTDCVGRAAIPGDRGTPLLPGRGAADLRAGASGDGRRARADGTWPTGQKPAWPAAGPYLPTCARRCWVAWIGWRWMTGGCWTTRQSSAGRSRCHSWHGCWTSPSLRWLSAPTGCRPGFPAAPTTG